MAPTLEFFLNYTKDTEIDAKPCTVILSREGRRKIYIQVFGKKSAFLL